MKLARPIVLLAALTALAGCEGIGDGSTVVSIEIREAGGQVITGPHPISQCLRDQLIAIATFTDGTTADFSYRVTWTSSDPAVVEVSNGDIPQVFVDNGIFSTLDGFDYRPGTLQPAEAAAPGATVTISAAFLGMTSSKQVEVTTPTLRIAPLKDGFDPLQAPPTAYVGPATFQRFGFFIEKSDGQVLLPNSTNLVGSLNPVLWTFQGGEFDAADTTVSDDYDKYFVPAGATSPTATITPAGGVVRGLAPENAVYTVQATTSVCGNTAAFRPTATVSVVPFATTTPLVMRHETDINGPGKVATGDLIGGSSEVVKIFGNLDTDGDGAGDATQDLSAQVDVRVTHTQACVVGTDTNCTCDSDGTNCTKRLLGNSGTFIFTLVTNDSAEATVDACFTNVDTVHTDDCDETPADSSQFQHVAAGLPIHVIPVDLTGAGATVYVQPASAAQVAFTYPGQQFDAFGTFTALSGTPFDRDGLNGAPSATGTQKITRNVAWTTRVQGSTTEFADAGFVRNADDGFFGHLGSFTYVEDVAAPTVVDVNFTLLSPYASIAAPTSPVPFTICPSTAGGCP